MKWFRLHSEFATDPKLKTFTKTQRYDLICLLCIANESKERGVINLDPEDIAATIDQDEAEYAAFIAKLSKKGILSQREDGAIVFTNWLTRQYDKLSDTPKESAARQQKRRVGAADSVTNEDNNKVSRGCHAGVTRNHAIYSDTDTDTDTEENKREEKKLPPEAPKKEPLPPRDMTKQLQLVAFCDFYAKYPVKQARQDAEKAWMKITPDETLRGAIMAGLANAKGSEEWHEDGGKYIPHPATFLNRRRWEDVYTPVGARPIIPARAANGYSQPSTLQGMIDDTARAVRAEEARLTDLRQAAQRKGLPQ